jgi:hypothetical protein
MGALIAKDTETVGPRQEATVEKSLFSHLLQRSIKWALIYLVFGTYAFEGSPYHNNCGGICLSIKARPRFGYLLPQRRWNLATQDTGR